MNETLTQTRSVVVEREFPFPPEKIWRALTQPHLIEEWLMKNEFQPVVDHRFNLRADWGAVECQVSYTWNATHVRCGQRSEECGDLDSYPNTHGDPPAHGAVGLPVGSAAVLRGRQGRVAAALCKPGTGLGADRLKSTGTFGSIAAQRAPTSSQRRLQGKPPVVAIPLRLVFRGGPIELE